MITLAHAGDAGPDVDHDAGTFVTEDRRKQTFRIGARTGEFIGMADAGRHDLDQHFACLRAIETNGFNRERVSRAMRNGGTNVQGKLPLREARNLTSSLRYPSVRQRR